MDKKNYESKIIPTNDNSKTQNPESKIQNINNEEFATKDNKHNVILISSFIIGIIFNILFFKNELAISYPIFIIAFYIAQYIILKDKIKIKFDLGCLLTIPIVMLSFCFGIYSNNVFIILNFLLIPFLIVTQSLILTKNNEYKWYDRGFLGELVENTLSKPFGNYLKPVSVILNLVNISKNNSKKSYAFKILIGFIISIPFLIIILALLSSADGVFKSIVLKVPDILSINLVDIFLQTIIFIIVFPIAFSFLYSFHKSKVADSKVSPEYKKLFDPIIVITFLTMINIVYFLFSSIQFFYLFGSIQDILPQNTTYAEYARRGFFELLLVTIFNLTVVLSSTHFTLSAPKTDKILKIINSLLVACTFIMLISAHFRMTLYEKTYGFTYLRIFTHAFMIFIFILLILVTLNIWKTNISFTKYSLIAGLTMYIFINYFNVDKFIIENNIKNNKMDPQYFTTLSYSAVPEMINVLKNSDKKFEYNVGNYLYNLKNKVKAKNNWQSFNLSKYRAYDLLDKHDFEMYKTIPFEFKTSRSEIEP